MFATTTSHKIALVGGCAVVGAAAHLSVTYSGGYGQPGMWMIVAAAFAVVAGSIALAKAEGRWFLAMLAGLCIGEAYAIVTTMDRVVTQRAALQAPARAAEKARQDAQARLQAAIEAKAKTEASAIKTAAEKDCKNRCEAQIREAKAEAAKELTEAQAAVAAMPAAPAVSPLAETLGWSPTTLELLMAVLGSLAANGLGGILIAFGAHGNGHGKPSRRDSEQTDFGGIVSVHPANDVSDEWNVPGPGPGNGPKGGNRIRRPATMDKATFQGNVIALVRDGKPLPSQAQLCTDTGLTKGTVSRWLSELEENGVIVRETVGRRKTIRAVA